MGLRQNDLEYTIDNVFEIDSYKSKMGEDSDIVTLSFAVKGDQPAKDLVKFIETGYDFVLDADKTSGEQSDGKYRVFVEIERSKKSPNQIDLIFGLDTVDNKYIKTIVPTTKRETISFSSFPLGFGMINKQ